MIKIFKLFFLLAFPIFLEAQTNISIEGFVKDSQTKKGLFLVEVRLEGTAFSTKTIKDGSYAFKAVPPGNYILRVKLKGYVEVRLPIRLDVSHQLEVPVIFLEADVVNDEQKNQISLSESDLNDVDGLDFSSQLLQATRDIFLARAAFDFSQAFFRVRGYDSREGNVLLNGVLLNKVFNGRPQWNNWGGLNDVTRSQQYTHGLDYSEDNFGGLLGTTNISTRASVMRKGLRISTSGSNRTYRGRLMATYSSDFNNKFSYSFSASRRWANEGFIEGSLYDAYSFFTSVEYKLNPSHSINFTGILASNRRGQSTAITDEVFELAGRQYNPFWGYQNGTIRNSRERNINEPIIMLNHFYKTSFLNINSSFTYQFGSIGRTRLSFFNAPNPDPVNFRALPSFYINNNGSPSFENAALARNAFIEDPQLNWGSLYRANSNSGLGGKSAYVLQEDRTDDQQFILNSIANLNIDASKSLDIGVHYKKLTSDNYALSKDLLGGSFLEDIDPFTNTSNDIQNKPFKEEGERFGYNYIINATVWNTFSQFRFINKKWNAFASFEISNTQYQREGQFQNERYSENSFGDSESVSFLNYGFKTGFEYLFNGRHVFRINGLLKTRAPLLQNTFINPRENNLIVPDLSEESILSSSVDYFLNLSNLKVRLSGFYTHFQNLSDIGFFFVESGLGSDFVQEVTTGINQLHYGGELGLAYTISPVLKFTLATSYGRFVYSNDPGVTLYFDTSDENSLNLEGVLHLGKSTINGYRLSRGPQAAYSIGLEYRDPNYWWFSISANQLSDNFIGISKVNRTSSFLLNPETGQNAPEATEEAVDELLKQEPLENIYLVNITGGKSWLVGKKYISLFMSINNALDFFYRSGGFEQSRKGNFLGLQQDRLRRQPSFGPRHWYGFGRSFFINLSVNF